MRMRAEMPKREVISLHPVLGALIRDLPASMECAWHFFKNEDYQVELAGESDVSLARKLKDGFFLGFLDSLKQSTTAGCICPEPSPVPHLPEQRAELSRDDPRLLGPT